MLSGAMLRDAGGKFWNNGQWQLRVTDAAGNKICALTFAADRSYGTALRRGSFRSAMRPAS